MSSNNQSPMIKDKSMAQLSQLQNLEKLNSLNRNDYLSSLLAAATCRAKL
jgi:hypothetical protein